MKKLAKTVLSLALTLTSLAALAACGGQGTASQSSSSAPKASQSSAASDVASSQASAQPVTIGSKDFTESLVVAEIYAQALESNGIEVNRKFNIGSSIVHTALINKEIDLYPEYTGTGLLSILKHELVTDPQEVYDIVKEEYKKQFDLVWLDYSAANDSQGLVLSKAAADQYGIKTISDLQKSADKIRFASQGEFDQREDGLPALIKAYGPFDFKSSAVYDNSLKYKLLSDGQADLAVAYTTEGALVDPQYVVLEDDKKVWPPYNLAPVARQSVLDADPRIETVLNKVSALIDTKSITALNAKVDVEKQEYAAVAAEFFKTIADKVKA